MRTSSCQGDIHLSDHDLWESFRWWSHLSPGGILHWDVPRLQVLRRMLVWTQAVIQKYLHPFQEWCLEVNRFIFKCLLNRCVFFPSFLPYRIRIAWFTNYSSDRVQCVKSEGLLSRHLAVYGGATGLNSWADSFLSLFSERHQWCRSCCRWFSDPTLCRHHSVYFWPFFGHRVNKPPDELQHHTKLLPWPPTALNSL